MDRSLGNITAISQPEAFEKLFNDYFSLRPQGRNYQYSPDKDELHRMVWGCIIGTENGVAQFGLRIHSEKEDEEWNIVICKNSLIPFVRFDLEKYVNRHRMDASERADLYDSLEKMVDNKAFSFVYNPLAKGSFYGEVVNVLCGCLAAYVPRVITIVPELFTEAFELFLMRENGDLLVKHFGDGVKLKGETSRFSVARYVFLLEELQEKIRAIPLTQDTLYQISGIGWADLFYQYTIHEEPLVPGAW